MDKKISILTVNYTLFLILLFASGSTNGILSEIIYYLAFLLPIIITLFLTRKDKFKGGFSVDAEKTGKFAPIIAPTVSVIVIISFLTSFLIFYLTGKTNSVDLGDSFILALLTHALLPALLEEAVFRYIPMRLLESHSRCGTVIISAIFFSLIHHNLFVIPYAFIAGVIFMTVDIWANSVIPSIIIHFINNALSVGLIFFSDNPAFSPVIYVLLLILTVISLLFILKRRDEYLRMIRYSFDKGEGFKISGDVILFGAVCLFIAIIGLL